MDRRYDHEQSEAYQQGRRDGLIEALEKRMDAMTVKVDENHSKTQGRFAEIEKRQNIAEKLMYLLTLIVALSEGGSIAKLLISGGLL